MGCGWDDQRWVRLGVLLTLLGKRFEAVGRAARQDIPYASSYGNLIGRANGHASSADAVPALPAGMRVNLSDEQADDVRRFLEAMANCDLRKRFPTKNPPEPFYAFPETDLRIRPAL